MNSVKAAKFTLMRLRACALQKRYSSTVKLTTQGPWKHHDTMSETQAQRMDATISSQFGDLIHDSTTKDAKQSSSGSVVPPGYHLVYFNPATPEHELSQDGYEDYQSPGPQFPNRMWLGGSVEFNKRIPLRLNNPAYCIETLHNLDASSGNVRVSLDRKMYSENSDDWSVRELRTLMYFTEQKGIDRKSVFERFIEPPSSRSASSSISLTPTAVTLFRYSALTFNSHRIHYDPVYCKDVEQMPGVIVHGPLTVTLLLRWVSVLLAKSSPKSSIRYFSYRNVLPMLVDNKLTMYAGDMTQPKFPVWITDQRGSLTVKGEIEIE